MSTWSLWVMHFGLRVPIAATLRSKVVLRLYEYMDPSRKESFRV